MNNNLSAELELEEEDTIEEEDGFTSWKNPPKIEDLKQDFQEAQSSHNSHVTKINTWLDNLHVRNGALVETKPGRSKIVPKLIRKQAEWRYAALSEAFLSTDDLFDISPVTWEDKQAAHQNELVLNNQFNTKINKIKFIDEFVRTVVDEGTAFVRVGWEYEDKEEEVEHPIIEMVPSQDPGYIQQLEQIAQALQQDPTVAEQVPPEMIQAVEMSMQAGMPLQAVQTGTEMVTETIIVKNQPTLDLCNYQNIIIDPTCEGDLEKASFIIYSFETSLSELKKDGKYKNLDKIQMGQVSPLEEPDHETLDDSGFKFKDKPRQKFVAYEYWGYWDFNGDGIAEPIVTTWVGNTIIRMEENPFPDGKPPFVSVQYLPVRKSVYGEPDGALLEDNQKIIGAVTRGMIDVMGRSANGQMGIRKDALDVTNKRKFDKGLDYEFNVNVDPRQAMHMHTYPEIPQSAQYMINMQNMEAESLTGVKAYSSGISSEALGKVATGIRGALDAASKRELGILRRLANGVIQIGRKIIAMNAIFLSEEEIVRVTNEEFVTVRRDDLPGNFDLHLTISTAEADNQKAQELAFMLQTMGNSMPMDMSQMILADIARLRKMPDLAKKIEEYQPQPDPMAEKMKELQLALLEAQVQNERAKAAENEVDVQLKTAKTKAELAKARAVGSDADLKDLDFIHKERGVDVEKEMVKKEFDRKANLDLRAVDALLKPKAK